MALGKQKIRLGITAADLLKSKNPKIQKPLL